MHELSIAQALLDQIESAARAQAAIRIASAKIRVGLLSGVEPALLQRAFSVARLARPMTAETVLEVETGDLFVTCADCGREASAVAPNDLSCVYCRSRRTQLRGGDELLLLSVHIDVPTTPSLDEWRLGYV